MTKDTYRSGTEGFSPQLAGHGKAGKSHTASFDAGPPTYTMPGYPAEETAPAGQEEGARMRQPTTSAVVRRVSPK